MSFTFIGQLILFANKFNLNQSTRLLLIKYYLYQLFDFSLNLN